MAGYGNNALSAALASYGRNGNKGGGRNPRGSGRNLGRLAGVRVSGAWKPNAVSYDDRTLRPPSAVSSGGGGISRRDTEVWRTLGG